MYSVFNTLLEGDDSIGDILLFLLCLAYNHKFGQKGKEHSNLWYFLRSGSVIFQSCDGRQTGCKILPFAR